MLAANINLPRILRVGAGASQQLVATLAELGLKRPLLVTDPWDGVRSRIEAFQIKQENLQIR